MCGGRDYENYGKVATVLSALASSTVIVEGGATGADRHAKRYAFSRGLRGETYPADWETHGKSAGPIRNQRMLDTGIDLVIAFPGGRGTEDMKTRARAAGVPVLEVT